MKINKNEFLVNEPISRLIRKYAVPCIISLLVGALYNIVDQIFIANANYLGSFGNAANTVVFPLTVIALAIAVMIGDGACTYVSLKLGKNQISKARHSIGNAIIMVILSSFILTIVYLGFPDSIISMFGGTVNSETFNFSREYFFWITIGIPFYMFGQAMNPIIRADGDPKFAMFATVVGAVTNIILDPIFIYYFYWGMMGAALATVIGQILTALLSFFYLLKMKTAKPFRKDLTINFKIWRRITILGITSFLSQVSLVASMAAVNNMIRKYGAVDPIFAQEQFAQIPMAVVGIVMKYFQIVISVVVGLAAGCIPIVGYNMGADRMERVKELFSKLLFFEAVVGAVSLIIVEIFPSSLLKLFGAANESIYYIQFGVKSFRIYLSMIILACVNKATFIILQAMGKAIESTVLSMTREILFGVGITLILPIFFGLNGVLYSMPVSDLLTFIISIIIIIKTYNELKVPTKIESTSIS